MMTSGWMHRFDALRMFVMLGMLCSTAICAQIDSAARQIDLPRNFARKPFPQWENDFFFGFEIEPPIVYAYDGDGRKLFDIPLKIEGAFQVIPHAMAASRDGVFAVGGGAYTSPGTGASFIAFLDRNGTVQRMVRLDRFAIGRLAWASDGTLWAAGRRSFPQRDEPDHDLIRAYSPAGTLRFSLLPRSSFPPTERHPAELSELATNGRQVVFLSTTANELVWISNDGKITARRRFQPPGADVLFTGFAISPGGDVYMSCQLRVPADKKKGMVGFFHWNDALGRWDEIYSRPSGGPPGQRHAIFGIEDGRMLVSNGLPRFEWIDLK